MGRRLRGLFLPCGRPSPSGMIRGSGIFNLFLPHRATQPGGLRPG